MQNPPPDHRLYSVGYASCSLQVSAGIVRDLMDELGIVPAWSINDLQYITEPDFDRLASAVAAARQAPEVAR